MAWRPTGSDSLSADAVIIGAPYATIDGNGGEGAA